MCDGPLSKESGKKPKSSLPPGDSATANLRAGHVIIGVERRSSGGGDVGVAAGCHVGRILRRDRPGVEVGVLIDVASRIAHEVTSGASTTDSRSSGVCDAVGRKGDGSEGTDWPGDRLRKLEGINLDCRIGRSR